MGATRRVALVLMRRGGEKSGSPEVDVKSRLGRRRLFLSPSRKLAVSALGFRGSVSDLRLMLRAGWQSALRRSSTMTTSQSPMEDAVRQKVGRSLFAFTILSSDPYGHRSHKP